ncbi:TOBE domain-containing protein [uncultured Methylobacterium sp.]|uniref:TOBE domain-containing protein n=1 Tax=uncultured Methylobacterium sp. TaxID=157278 RepID=UPI00261F93FE|nr:TOBE domain-containing protein [uncultured Methylobacterium sp.]
MKISARNVAAGSVREETRGSTAAPLRVETGGGQDVTAAITDEAVDDLGRQVGQAVKVAVDRAVAVPEPRHRCGRPPLAERIVAVECDEEALDRRS